MPDRRLLLLLLFVLVLLSAAAGASYIQPTTTATTSPPVRIVTVVLTTAPPPGGLAVTSTPAGAAVYLNGVKKGTTPLTVQPLAAGSYDLRVTLDGYRDYTSPVTITSGTERRDVVLVPVTKATTATPAPSAAVPIRIVTPAPVPVQKVPPVNLTAEFRFPQPVSILPLNISVNGHTKTPHLSTLSPYFSYQLGAGRGATIPPDIKTTPTSYIEVDSYNVYLPQSHLMSGAEMALDPVWGDNDTVYIETTDRFSNNTNFRWIGLRKDLTGFYQVSRFPFDSNASHWQNEYVPGLVVSGPVKDVHVDSDGFHYFSLNFAPIANHNPSSPPFYTGVAKLQQTVPGKGKPMGVVKVPVINLGIWTAKTKIGGLTLPVPAAVSFLPAGELTESELGNPNGDMILSEMTDVNPTATFTEAAIAGLPKQFYVRVVPMNPDGSAGIPTIPVTVTVLRPDACPPSPPPGTENDVFIKPPSGTVASFYLTSFVPDWIHTDDTGALVFRAYFVTVAPNPACSAPKSGNSLIDDLNSQSCAQTGGSVPGYHFYADPVEKHWYDTVWDIITGIFGAFAQVIHAVSSAWNEIQNIVADITARYISAVVLLGLYHCEDHPACVDVIHTADSAALAALGVPPTIPDISDMESMGADYMARIAAEEVGADGILDTAGDVYDNLPDDVKSKIKGGANDIGKGITDNLVSQTGSTTSAAAGNFYIPDPLYYQPHPAMAMVKVFNPNGEPTDPVDMSVTDSAGLFRQSQSYYIPALKPGDSTVVPVVLEEDYTKVYTPDCNDHQWWEECGDICVPCFWNNWYGGIIDSSKNGGDTFNVAFSAKKGGYPTGGLTPSTSGKVLVSQNIITLTAQGKSCGTYNTKTVLKYPDGWQMQLNGQTQDLWSQCWLKYSFTEGAKGRLIGG